MRKAMIFGLAFALGWFAVPASAQENVRFSVDWVISGRFTPYYVAIEKGYFREGGLEVSVTRGYGGASTVKTVAGESIDIAQAGTGPALVSIAQESPLRIVSIIYGKAPYMIISKAKAGITRPKDLEGKRIGAPAGDENRYTFPAFAALTGIDEGRVKWVTMDGAAKTPSLLADKVDAVPHYVFERVKFKMLEDRHGQFNFMMYSDSGLDLYGSGLLAHNDYIREKPNALRAFVRATVRAFEWTINNPQEANAIFLRHQPTLDKAINLGELDSLRELVVTEEAKRYCIGWIDEKKLARTRDILFKALNVKETLDVKKAYTTEFLPCG